MGFESQPTPSFYQHALQKHVWDPSPEKARKIQERLQKELIFDSRVEKIDCIAGVDVGFNRNQSRTKAAVVILSLPGLETIDQVTAEMETPYPYIPGLLSFREVPVILKALDKLDKLPDVLLCDSQGYAHPRRFGLACHLGVLTDLPTLGVAKSKLIGGYEQLSPEKGSSVPLIDGDEQIGIVLRSRTKVNPIFISVGHKIGLQKAKSVVMQALTRYKLPETTRRADQLASL